MEIIFEKDQVTFDQLKSGDLFQGDTIYIKIRSSADAPGLAVCLHSGVQRAFPQDEAVRPITNYSFVVHSDH